MSGFFGRIFSSSTSSSTPSSKAKETPSSVSQEVSSSTSKSSSNTSTPSSCRSEPSSPSSIFSLASSSYDTVSDFREIPSPISMSSSGADGSDEVLGSAGGGAAENAAKRYVAKYLKKRYCVDETFEFCFFLFFIIDTWLNFCFYHLCQYCRFYLTLLCNYTNSYRLCQ